MLKEKIQSDFVSAMKEKNVISKTALSGLKSKITEAEKSNGNQPLNDNEIIKVITSCIKQRKQSVEEFTKGNRLDLAENELNEIKVLEVYLPKQMTEEEIETEVKIIMDTISDKSNVQRLVGQTIGQFNKKFTGTADISIVKNIIEKIASSL
jgi:uncharacterized protein YqeY